MTGDLLLKVLDERREAIRRRWAGEVMASSPKYSGRPEEEILASVDDMIAGLRDAVASGDYSRLFEFSNRMVSLRSSMGFKLTEIQRVINIGTSTIIDEVRRGCSPDDQEECFAAFRKLLDVTYWASMHVGDVFEEIRSKEFTAGTLIALAAAQEELDEGEVMRRSLELVMGLMHCSHGAISMHHLGGIAVQLPPGHRQCGELFSRLSGRVMRDRRMFALHGDELAGLGPPAPGGKEECVSCAAGVPIRARGRVIGALLLASVTERDLSHHEGAFLEAVASQIGLACDDARMMEQVRRREESVRKELGEIMTIMNELGAMVYVADISTYELLAANRPITEAFGKDIIGRRCYEVLQSDQEGPCSFCTNQHLVRDGRPTGPYSWRFQNTRTGRWYQCLDRAIEWPDGRLARLEIALDVTELEEAGRRLEEISSALGLYNDLLVHDIANYAGAAKAFVQLMGDPGVAESKKADMAASAASQLNKIEVLVDRISKLTRLKTRRAEELSRRELRPLLDEAIEDVRARPEGAAVEFVREYGGDGQEVELGGLAGDIFVNLISNAAKYGGGRPVTVRVSASMVGTRPAWRVSVEDQGKGVPPDKKGLLFSRYQRLSTISQLKGQGLGLTIVKSLTEAYGGEAGVEDLVPGDHTKGSIFWVAFPKAGPPKA
ncbi:MAG: ATP-binding protein [Candidatus Thermoplasmatota archaeon]